MKIVLIGATGNVGSRLLTEALRRKLQVTAMVRDPKKLPKQPNLTVVQGDITHEKQLEKLLAGHDAVISAYNPGRGAPDYEAAVLRGYRTLFNAARKTKETRVIIVGGAGSLEVAPGVQLVDTPTFPAEYKMESSVFRDLLNLIRKENSFAWTYVSPSAFFAPGERTGKFRLGNDQLLVGADGQSRISMEDFAIAVLDEIEHPKHIRRRFTVGY